MGELYGDQAAVKLLKPRLGAVKWTKAAHITEYFDVSGSHRSRKATKLKYIFFSHPFESGLQRSFLRTLASLQGEMKYCRSVTVL